jgi:uncharacterized protein YdhG (YjbR/CyaY superfamily)
MRANQPRATTVDEYIKGFPRTVQGRLKAIRKVVKQAAPAADEVISYGIPAYKLKGIVVYFAAHTHHIGMYPAPRADAAFRKALSAYGGGKGTVQFPSDEPIPLALVRRIVAFQVKKNLDRALAKGKKKRSR